MLRVDSLCDGLVEGGIGPFGGVADEAVFHRVEMNVVEMGGVIFVVADRVFPEAPLPEAAFASGCTAGGAAFAVGDLF